MDSGFYYARLFQNLHHKKKDALPQALTCQGRRRSAAAAHAKDPARPVMQSAFRAKWLWRKICKFFKFFEVYTATFFQNPCCAARGHALAV